MRTAQELYTTGIREHFAPALRSLGFHGWRHSFSLPDRDRWAVLGVHAEPSDGRVRYTLNLSVTDKAVWDRRRIRPDANAPTGLERWRAPIGDLLPVGGEVWWEIAPGPRWLVAVEDSVAAVRGYALPELRRRLRPEDRERYLGQAELDGVNGALATASVARIQRAELASGVLELHGAWSRHDPAAHAVLAGAARGFLSARDRRFAAVRVRDTLGRTLWEFPGRDDPGPVADQGPGNHPEPD
ncbi:hypothetical protein [Streptomyces sp. TLI_171]|uniref:hypothetical protein n=1 Tax=Streptomyces sp. TLI_171 TaxID=1938859 RepID=UPI000C19A656|nr:hypothetical protein [Streptomyces sp. TLI_171]